MAESEMDDEPVDDPRDPLLQVLVRIVEDQKKEFPVTVAVGGVVLTGNIITAEQFFKESSLEPIWEKPPDLASVEEAARQTGYLHLRATTAYAGGTLLAGGLWRCRIDLVGASCIGVFGKNVDSQ